MGRASQVRCRALSARLPRLARLQDSEEQEMHGLLTPRQAER